MKFISTTNQLQTANKMMMMMMTSLLVLQNSCAVCAYIRTEPNRLDIGAI